MDLTRSFERVLPRGVLSRFDLRETRNAAAVLAATNPIPFREIARVLAGFRLQAKDLTARGGSKSRVPQRLDGLFRRRGWREGRHDTRIESVLRLMPCAEQRESRGTTRRREVVNEGHKIDNVKDGVAVEVEWHAKDGNLDRDLAAFRALYDVGVIDGGVILTRSFSAIRALSIRLGRPGGFATTTTTTLEKLEPRLTRGDGGGCPVLAVAITDRCYRP